LTTLEVWCAPVARRWPADSREELLNSSEVQAGEAMRSDERRWEYWTVRALARRLLTAHFGVWPGMVTFPSDARGKPSVCEHPWRSHMHISFSHSAGFVAVAATRDGPVGVDLERVASFSDRVAMRTFSHSERQRLARLEGVIRDREFFRIWTLKEAVSKAWGLGMAMSFPRVEIANGTHGWSAGCKWWTIRRGCLVASVACIGPEQSMMKPKWRIVEDVVSNGVAGGR
jgi:4'-phosphopantetheinyl transferase